MDWKSSLEQLRADLPQGAEQLEADAPQPAANASEKGHLDIILDKKGRKGKAATIVAGFTVDDDAVEEIARKLKQQLGTGGSSRGGEILIQGDKRREVADALTRMGLKNRII
jgi:translation initiation factor 1